LVQRWRSILGQALRSVLSLTRKRGKVDGVVDRAESRRA